jgi:hypothetical protein
MYARHGRASPKGAGQGKRTKENEPKENEKDDTLEFAHQAPLHIKGQLDQVLKKFTKLCKQKS